MGKEKASIKLIFDRVYLRNLLKKRANFTLPQKKMIQGILNFGATPIIPKVGFDYLSPFSRASGRLACLMTITKTLIPSYVEPSELNLS